MPQVKFKTIRDFIETHNTRLQDIANTIKEMLSGSDSLIALGDKIEWMLIHIGSPVSVYPFLNRIVTKGVKHFSQGIPGYDPEPLGRGHFRWNWRLYTLTDAEMKTVIKVFKYIRG